MPDSSPVLARSEALYDRVKAVIPPTEWRVFLGGIHAILQFKHPGHARLLWPQFQKPEVFHCGAALLGGKGANLAEMTSVLGVPAPPGFTISTVACRAYMEDGWPDGLDAEVARARARLERAMGKEIGDEADPLLVSVRSGAMFSMPGMMDTVLNLGLNDRSVAGLAKQTDDERFAYDSYRRFISMYARIVLGIPAEEFDTLFDAAKELAGATSDARGATDPLR